MDLEQHLNHLEAHRDWQGLVDAIEHAIAGTADAITKSQLHLRLGRLQHRKFLQGVKALKHFQDAYKINPALVDALASARAIYLELGKLNMVQKLLELELKAVTDPVRQAALLVELGDTLRDQGDAERAASQYAQAIKCGGARVAAPLLEDAQASADDWQERVGELLRAAHASSDVAEKSALLTRAARIVNCFAPGDVQGVLEQAYVADPHNLRVAALLEGLLVEANSTERIYELQRAIVESTAAAADRAAMLRVFGARWAIRHQNHEVAAGLLEQAARLDPDDDTALLYLRDVYGARMGDWRACSGCWTSCWSARSRLRPRPRWRRTAGPSRGASSATSPPRADISCASRARRRPPGARRVSAADRRGPGSGIGGGRGARDCGRRRPPGAGARPPRWPPRRPRASRRGRSRR
jgi:tetratricopeptide (TPR) repeat protein